MARLPNLHRRCGGRATELYCIVLEERPSVLAAISK